ncbi:MAG: redoxin domain-containing protein [Bacteroidetes bacterium]|nr:redoxin domain-containing protein [Bacteroidota bacterium]MCK5765426.1 redoxin domain-containing protein [Bacteroidales bacterium]
MKKFSYLILFLFLVNISFAQTQLDTAVNFSVKDIHGNTIELFPMLDEGKLVVIDFFSTTCAPCILYAPEVQASYEDFGENGSNVYFVGICWGDDNNGVAYFDSVYGLTFPSVSGSQGGGNTVHNNFLVQSVPTVILIAPDREILEQYIWEPTRENLNAAIIAAGGSMVGIDDQFAGNESGLFVYPNPATSLVNVQFDVKEASLFHLETYNILGTRVAESPQVSLTAGSHVINTDLSRLPGGTYFIRLLRNGQQESMSRLILLD